MSRHHRPHRRQAGSARPPTTDRRAPDAAFHPNSAIFFSVPPNARDRATTTSHGAAPPLRSRRPPPVQPRASGGDTGRVVSSVAANRHSVKNPVKVLVSISRGNTPPQRACTSRRETGTDRCLRNTQPDQCPYVYLLEASPCPKTGRSPT